MGAAPDGRAAIYVLTDRAGVRPVDNIDGIPVVTRYVGTVVALAAKGAGPMATPAAAPLMGTSTGNDKECAAGTLGCVVVKGTARYFLSNNHVFARENAAANGERIDAPGRYDGKPRCSQTPQIATLSSFQAISFNSNNTIDAAIAQPVNGLAFSCAEKGGYIAVRDRGARRWWGSRSRSPTHERRHPWLDRRDQRHRPGPVLGGWPPSSTRSWSTARSSGPATRDR